MAGRLGRRVSAVNKRGVRKWTHVSYGFTSKVSSLKRGSQGRKQIADRIKKARETLRKRR